MIETTTAPPPTERQVGADLTDCPECESVVTIPHSFGGEVVACPQCGQCLSASGAKDLTNWGLIRPQWPLSHTPDTPAACLIGAVVFGGCMFVPFVDGYGQAAAACVATAFTIQGLNRWLQQARAKASVQRGQVATELPRDERFGPLKAVFQSRVSVFDSLVLVCLALSLVLGMMWAISSLVDEIGDHSLLKLILVAFVALATSIYVVYRALRAPFDRQSVFIYQHGLRWVHRGVAHGALWGELNRLTAAHLGDLIDGDAILLEFRSSRPDRKFTRGSFDLFPKMWERIYQEAEPQISSGQIQVRVCASPESLDQ